jgi:methionyl-tRNA synthetase
VPGDEESVIYVWFDALTNYLTVCGYPDDEDGFRNAWPPDVQLMAKDILQRFHGTLWPAMLMAAGLDLPKRLFAHGFWTVERRKISKSIGNVIYPSQIAADLAAASGSMPAHCIDAIRYFLLREVPFGLDGDFSVQALAGRFNADLANDLSNLLNRTLPVLGRVSEGCIPSSGAADSVCQALAAEIDACGSGIEALDFSGGLVALWRGLAILNKYLDQEAPWSASARRPEAGRALYTVLDGLRAVSTALVPFMPKTGSEILRRLGVPPEEMGAWENACSFQKLAAGWRIAVERPLFRRFPVERLVLPSGEAFSNVPASAPGGDREAGGSQIESPGSKLEEPVHKTSESISMEDFSRADMRVGTVVQAERVSGTDRLISLVVDTGGGTRTVVAGIGDKYEPEGLLDKQLIVVTNLPPVRIRGIISEGMILAVGEKSVEALLTVDRPVGPGAKVR